ncbi:MAG: hypothetical protein OER83_07450 [Flavobacteriaceae bacterium]|nr:hypothetical protein [Flavobacteriaceae bacterium]MDH3796691.1 hypothetical protein [Flavobacteriaceae bacterium]
MVLTSGKRSSLSEGKKMRAKWLDFQAHLTSMYIQSNQQIGSLSEVGITFIGTIRKK